MMFGVMLATRFALAVKIQGADLPCPTGEGTIRVNQRLSEDSFGGWDSDFARHSSNGQWRTYQLATCTSDLYTVYAHDVSVVPADRADAVLSALSRATPLLADPKNPTLWERYDLAMATYGALGRDAGFLARLALEATWTIRDAAVGYIPNIQGPTSARAYLSAGWEELKKPLSDEDRKNVLFNLARIAERGGYTAERDGYLGSLSAMPLSSEEAAGIERFRKLTHEVMPVWQDKAILALSAAQRAKLDDHVGYSYALADTLRRRGRTTEALALYLVIADDRAAPKQVRDLAGLMLDELGG